MSRIKFLSVFLSLFFIIDFSLSAAPKIEGNIKKIKPNQTVTLDVYSQLANYSGEQSGWFSQLLLEKFNVKINIISETEGTFKTRMDTGNLGDIVIWSDNSENYVQACKNGLLIDWEADELLENWGPFIKSNMKLALQKNKFIDSPDKKMHGFGNEISTSAKEIQSFEYTWNLRFDLYEQIEKPQINELNDLVEVFSKMKEICPIDNNKKQTYALSLFHNSDKNLLESVSSIVSAYFGYDEFDFGFYNPEDGKFYDCLDINGPYIYVLKFLNQLNQKNLLTPDSNNKKYNEMLEDYKNGTTFWNVSSYASREFNSEENVKNKGMAMYPVCPKNAHPFVKGQNIYGGNQIWSIGSKTEYPELCMAIINWLSTPEVTMTIKYGPEDICWKIKNEKTSLTEFGKKALENQKNTNMPSPFSGTFYEGILKINNTIWSENSVNPLSNVETFNYKNWESEQKKPQSEIEKKWSEWSGETNADNYLKKCNYILNPCSLYVKPDLPENLSSNWNTVAECIKTESWNAIYAQNDEDFNKIIDTMITEAKKSGYEDVCEYSRKLAEKRKCAEKISCAKK